MSKKNWDEIVTITSTSDRIEELEIELELVTAQRDKAVEFISSVSEDCYDKPTQYRATELLSEIENLNRKDEK